MNQLEKITRNLEHLISERELEERLREDRPLRIKLGIDPTRPDLTLGHMVVFNKLRDFQELGHQAVLIIGDFTTLVGDPSGRSSERPIVTKEEVERNSKTYLKQAFKVLDENKTIVRRNSEWFTGMNFESALDLARKMTVARMLERDDFSKRYTNRNPISIVEFLYPLLQGYDSIMVKSDIEIGGTDQLFNLLVGRTLQKEAGMAPQIVLTTPLLVGLDGVMKMSKSLDNFVAFNEAPKNIFGKIMSVNDKMMWDYFRLLLNTPEEKIDRMKLGHPMKAKKDLALGITTILADSASATSELKKFETVFSKREVPEEMPIYSWNQLSVHETSRLVDLIAATKLFPSRKEARRLLEQGAVRLDSKKIVNPSHSINKPEKEVIVQAGKRVFFKILA